MLHKRRLLVVLAFLHLFSYAVMTDVEPPSSASLDHDEQEIQRWLLLILTNSLQESRYAAFENAINEYEVKCYHRAREQIDASDKLDRLDMLGKLAELYENHVKNYPKQNRQAILDNRPPGPIARNAGFTVNALCHQMHGFAQTLPSSSNWDREAKTIQTWLLHILTNGLQESRYMAFEKAVDAYETNCYERAREKIDASNNANKSSLRGILTELYEKRVEDYAKQYRQAILDNQPAAPVAESAGIAVNALCRQMHGFAQTSPSASLGDEEQEIQNWLLQILPNGAPGSQYAAFENAIIAYEANCYQRARDKINATNKTNKLDLFEKLAELYEVHVKDYPKQNRQAILDNHPPESIAKNAGKAINALCHKMHSYAL